MNMFLYDDEQLREVISDIVKTVDYDLWKESFNEETAEDPESVENNYQYLEDIIRSVSVKVK